MSYIRNNYENGSVASRVPYPGDPHSYYSFAAQALSKVNPSTLTPMQQQQMALYQQQMAAATSASQAYSAGYSTGNIYNANPSIVPYGKSMIILSQY